MNMNIISYRGLPKDASGKAEISGGNVSVSASLFRLVRENRHLRIRQPEASGSSWFNWVKNDLQVTGADGYSKTLQSFSDDTIERHYRCSNGLFWPLLHLYPEFVLFDEKDYAEYLAVNEAAARAIITSGKTEPVNVHDYQLFGLPKLLKEAGIRSTFFLHLPFPRKVDSQYVWAMEYAVKGMLGAEVIGVHIPNYRKNLLAFVKQHLGDQYVVDRKAGTITSLSDGMVTRVVVSPIGTNAKLWKQMSEQEVQLPEELAGKKMFMLIGRSDPAKGIPNSVRAWALFQKRFPVQAKDCVMLVISTPSREQVDCFKTERLVIEDAVQRVQERHPGTLVFRNVGLPAHELASYYRQASALVACSKAEREGWGLTGPEFVACQDASRGGVVAMSQGVGAYSRFGDCVVELDPEDPNQMAEAFASMRSSIGSAESVKRMETMQGRIPTMPVWWDDMQIEPRLETAVA